MNTLCYGDNLEILREHVKDKTVDLVTLDPPLNSNLSYNVLFKARGEGTKATHDRFRREDEAQSGGRLDNAGRRGSLPNSWIGLYGSFGRRIALQDFPFVATLRF